ncbi:MAG: DUF5686 and carboxypeptidase regulatory-like domain-containing protein [Bacteroidota bacterium]
MKPLLLLFSTLFTATLAAQGISGSITSAATGETLPFASIYVEEIGSGTVTNAEGNYRLRLRPGTYTLSFQFLGYATKQQQVEVGNSWQTLNIQLNSESLELVEIEVTDDGEDVSYPVIRRAIAKADYHRQQVDHYEAQVYIKGTGKINKFPQLILSMMDEEEREEIDTSRVYTGESVSRISYDRPNTFHQEVISVYQTGSAQADATPFIFGSFYQKEIAGAISPLSPRAFGYYRFEHQGMFYDRGHFINKIQVSSRSRGDDVFNGYIYIVEDDWSIHSLDLVVYKFGIRFEIKQTYAPLRESLWMPISGTIDVFGKVFGVDFEYHYLTTLSDYSVQLNEELPAYVEVIDERSQRDEARRVRSENRNRDYEQILAEGGELTRRELRQLVREYEREERRELEEPEVVGEFSIDSDSAIGVADTAFWAEVRPVPLTDKEQEAYIIDAIENPISLPDSLASDADTLTLEFGAEGSSLAIQNARRRQNWRFAIAPSPIFNPVEGYVLGAKLQFKRNGRRPGLNREARPAIGVGIVPRYGFAREKMTLAAGAVIVWPSRYNKTTLRLAGGRNLRQFDPDEAIDPWLNVLTSLLGQRNYLRLYERRFTSIRVEREIEQDWTFNFDASYEDRSPVSNNSNAAWFKNDEGVYLSNQPVNGEINPSTAVGNSNAVTVSGGFLWRPSQRYRVRGNNRSPINDSSPEIGFQFRAGLPIAEAPSDYLRLSASFRDQIKFGARGRLDLLVRGSYYLNNTFVDFADFRHFPTTNISLAHPDPLRSYRLLPIYENSTVEESLEVFAHYQFRKFLLTRIWEIQKLGWREDLFVNYLHTPTSENYTELGYTIDGLFRIIRVEFVSSWRDFEFEDFGVRIGVTTNFGNLFN